MKATLSSLALLGGVVTVMTISILLQHKATPRIQTRVSVLTVWFVAILAWPFIWTLFLKDIEKSWSLIPGLLWPLAILTLDIRAMTHTSYESHAHAKRSTMTMDANALCSLTFALSGILGAQNDPCCRTIFLYAVIGCIAFVLPAPHSGSNSTTEIVVVESVQKAVLAYSTGLLLTGIMMMRNKQTTKAV